MKTQNRLIVLGIILSGFILSINSGCKKYQEGPAFSFHSKNRTCCKYMEVDNYKLTEMTSPHCWQDTLKRIPKTGIIIIPGGV